MNFADRLLNEIDKKQNPSVVGLDPRIEKIPQFIKDDVLEKYGNTLKAVGEGFLIFNKRIINSIKNIVAIVKPQIAFYERYGIEGIKAFQETVNYAKMKGLIVIEDAKRNDIGSTARAYSDGHLGKAELIDGTKELIFDLDAITINPYLGSDGIKPFIEDIKKYGKGCFILVKTSNPSSGELQDKLLISNETIYERLGALVAKWGAETKGERGYQSVGAVVGATFPEEARKLRKIMTENIFLMPGYGAQGARGKEIINSFNKDGYGAIISNSRGIIFAYESMNNFSEEEHAEASAKAALDMKEDINRTLKASGLIPW